MLLTLGGDCLRVDTIQSNARSAPIAAYVQTVVQIDEVIMSEWVSKRSRKMQPLDLQNTLENDDDADDAQLPPTASPASEDAPIIAVEPQQRLSAEPAPQVEALPLAALSSSSETQLPAGPDAPDAAAQRPRLMLLPS